MFKHHLVKTALLSSLLGTSLTVLSPEWGLASTFYLQQKDDSGNIELSGQFTGEDVPILTLNELTSFNLSVYGDPVWVLSDLSSFFYSISSNSIEFSAAKVEDINDGNILHIDRNLYSNNISEPFLLASETIYFVNGEVLIGDLFSSQPIQVSSSQIPEGNSGIALGVLGIYFLLDKRLKSSNLF